MVPRQFTVRQTVTTQGRVSCVSRTPIFTKYKVQWVFFTVTQLMSINHPRFSDCFTCGIYNKVQALKSFCYISFSSVLYLTSFIVNSITYEHSVTNEFFMFHSVNTVLLQLHFHSLFIFKTSFFSHNILSLISFIKSYIKILSLNICLLFWPSTTALRFSLVQRTPPQKHIQHKPITGKGQILITQTAFLIHHIN